jgi:hypothetical protein
MLYCIHYSRELPTPAMLVSIVIRLLLLCDLALSISLCDGDDEEYAGPYEDGSGTYVEGGDDKVDKNAWEKGLFGKCW